MLSVYQVTNTPVELTMSHDDRRAEAILATLRAGQLPADGFDHRAHLLVGWHLVRTRPLHAGVAELGEALTAATIAAGVPDKYDAALTRRWMLRLAELADGADDFAAVLDRHPELSRRAP
jgi:hypothetical protein